MKKPDEFAKSGAVFDGVGEFAELVSRDAFERRRKALPLSDMRLNFYCEENVLVDIDEVNNEVKQRPLWQLCFEQNRV